MWRRVPVNLKLNALKLEVVQSQAATAGVIDIDAQIADVTPVRRLQLEHFYQYTLV